MFLFHLYACVSFSFCYYWSLHALICVAHSMLSVCCFLTVFLVSLWKLICHVTIPLHSPSHSPCYTVLGCSTSGVVLSPFPRSVFPPGLTSVGGFTPYCMQQQPYYTHPPGPNPGLWKSPSVSDLTSIYQMSNSHYGVNNTTSNPPAINSSIHGGPFSSSPLPNTTAAPNQPPNSLPLLPNTCTVEPIVAASNTGSGTEMYAQISSHAQSQMQQGRTGSPIGISTGVSTVGVQSSSEIDRIMAKIEQDNRILAELDKTRSTIGKCFFMLFCSLDCSTWFRPTPPICKVTLCLTMWPQYTVVWDLAKYSTWIMKSYAHNIKILLE